LELEEQNAAEAVRLAEVEAFIVFEGRVADLASGLARLESKLGFNLMIDATTRKLSIGDHTTVQVRSENVRLSLQRIDAENVLQCRIERIVYEGAAVNYHLSCDRGSQMIASDVNKTVRGLGPDDIVWASFDARNCVALDD
jgi:ABC-type Fe3+/spermidine/putrescine transport system ATPase subunit